MSRKCDFQKSFQHKNFTFSQRDSGLGAWFLRRVLEVSVSSPGCPQANIFLPHKWTKKNYLHLREIWL